VPQVDPASGERLWLLARYEDVREGLHHPDLGHQLHGEPAATWIERLDRLQLINLDPPDHTRLRALVSRAFTPRAVAALEPRIAALADRLIDEAPDAVDAEYFAEPVPVAVIADLIGVPPEDRRTFRAWSRAIMSGDPELRDAATLEFATYIDGLRADDGLIAALRPLLERDELVATIQLLLIAGQETAVYVIAHGLRALLARPGQWDALCEDPSLAAAAVEEVVRFDGPVEIAPPRYALRQLGPIPQGDKVGLAVLGANRDPEAFADPDVFDIRRADVGRHLGFGHGIHYCLGAGLGRLEGRVVFRRLAERLPGVQLTTEEGE
jgi:cytochrome P450